MKLSRLVVVSILVVVILGGCQFGVPGGDDFHEAESWEFRPFYGESQFLVVDEETGVPIPEAMLAVTDLSIVELEDADSVHSDEDGVITIHQLERGIVYWGKGPPPPTFTFSAPGYLSQTHSVDDLVAGTAYDPYSDANLPSTTFQNGEQVSELPLYEFTIRLVTSD